MQDARIINTRLYMARSLPLFRRLWWEYLKGHSNALVLSIACMILVAVMSSTQTYLMGTLIDRVFVGKDVTLLWAIAAAVVVLFAVRSAARYGQEVLLVSIGQAIVAKAQRRMFVSSLHQDIAQIRSEPAGAVAARFTYDANVMRLAVCDVFLVAGKDTLTILTMVGLMFFSNWRLALLTLIIVPLCILPVLWLGRKMRKIMLRTQAEMGELTRVTTETFQSIRAVKVFGLEDSQIARARVHAKRITQLVIRGAWVGGAILPIVDGIGGIVVAAVIIFGGAQVIAETITPGTLFVFVGALVGAYAPIPSLSKVNITLQTGLAGAQRVFGLLDRSASIVDRPGAVDMPRVAGEVALDGVVFSYGEEPVLRGLDLLAPAGAVTALVGRSGGGKSTILNLISRFYDPDEGLVRVNGMDVRNVSLASLRETMMVVSQDVVLFDDTIANNIRLGRPDASDEEVQDAAEAAAAWHFIRQLPLGFETRVGEHGYRLSGGQRQRIAIARAILRDAPIILLDEATSAQDAESDRHIRAALARLMRGRTTIVIAHHLATVRNADQIYVIDEGRVIESGTHNELIAQNGLYTHLHDIQLT